MAQQMDEVDALRARISHLKHALATTTCRITVDALRQMLGETEVKLFEISVSPPSDNPTRRMQLRG